MHVPTCQLSQAAAFLAMSGCKQLSGSAIISSIRIKRQFDKAAAFLNNSSSQWHTFLTINLHRDQLIGCTDEVLQWTVRNL
jgi:hypothetical protein